MSDSNSHDASDADAGNSGDPDPTQSQHRGEQPTLPLAGLPTGRFGDFELLAEIGRGGMGVVYRARQISLDRIVALKIVQSGQFASPEEIERFRAEAAAAGGLNHPGIVPIYQVGEDQSLHYYAMGYVEGQSVSQRLREGPLPPVFAAEVVRQVAEAVHYAHANGIIHRDLKPGNILLDLDGTPRVADFGLAKQVASESNRTVTGQVLGTPSYMPPEQASGENRRVGVHSDVYSLGAVLYATLTGRPPFQADSPAKTLWQVMHDLPVPPRQLNAEVPRDAETICLKCLEKAPEKRYADAQALADDLGRFLSGDAIHARRIGRLGRAWR